MSNVLTSFLLALGGGTWIYYKLARSSGGNTRSALTAAGISAAMLFLACLLLLGALFKK